MHDEAPPAERASAAAPEAAFDVAPELFGAQTDDHAIREDATL